jgi:hypothetical protein
MGKILYLLFAIFSFTFFRENNFSEDKKSNILIDQKQNKGVVCEIDTNINFIYSFKLNKTQADNSNTSEKFYELLEVCEGSNVLLEAPEYHDSRFYYWEGPNGFRSYSPNIYFENSGVFQSGRYILNVNGAFLQMSGYIDLIIKEKPKPNIVQFSDANSHYFFLERKGLSAKLTWTDFSENFLAETDTLKLSSGILSEQPIFLKIEDRICENKFQINLNDQSKITTKKY